jgi:hypothetical protein
MKNSIFWDITPYNPLKVNGRFEGTYRLHHHDETSSDSYAIHDSFLFVLFSTLKMEVTYSSITSVDFQRNTRRYIPEDRTLKALIGLN